MCGIFVVRGLCLHRALHRCVLQETAPRPGFGFSALPVLQCGILLLFLGLGFPLLPIHSISDLGSYSHSLYLRVDLGPSEVENLLLLTLLPLLQENLETCYQSYTGMLILVLVLVLKDSLRTFFKSLSLSWSLGVRSLSLSLSLGGRVQEVLVLVLVLGGQVLVLILVLVV